MLDFYAQKIKISGPKIDGSFVVTLETGEDQQLNVAKLLAIPQNRYVKVTVQEVETEDDE